MGTLFSRRRYMGGSEDKRIVCTYNISDGTANTYVFSSQNNFKTNTIQSVEIDGVLQQSVEKSYLLSTGEHVLKIEVKDNSTVPTYMFYGVTTLESAYLPKNFKTISAQSFRGCSELVDIDMPGIERIGYLGFYHCTKLPAVDLSNCKYLEGGVFEGCSLLADVGSVANLIDMSYTSHGEFGETKVSGNFVFSSFTGTGISANLFNQCSGVTSVSFPLSEYTKIGASAFYQTSIEEFVVREGCTELNNHTFGGSKSALQYLDLPSTLTAWNGYACYLCNKNKVIVCRATTPPAGMNANSFNAIPADCKVYVPSASISAYESATGWTKLTGRYVAIEGTWYENHRSLGPIQDGLIFHLDGIDKGNNEGYWTDLVGGVKYTIPTSDYLSVDTKGFTFTGDVTMSKSSGTIPTGTDVTLEIAMYNTRSASSSGKWGCFSSGNTNAAGSLCIAQFNTRLGFINRTASIDYSDFVFGGFSTNSANADRICINKSEVSMSSSASTDYVTGTNAAIGKGYAYGGMRGTIYAIRIYNRKLTLAEMQFNQDIDLKRFGT